MTKLDNILDAQQQEARQLTIDECLALGEDIEPLGDVSHNGLCPNRMLCMVHRLEVSLDAIENGYKCAFEEHDALWQCHLSGVPKPMEV